MSFSDGIIYVSLGLCPVTSCYCICVDTNAPHRVLHPPNSRKYVVQTQFLFTTARKSAFAIIMRNLVRGGIYPQGNIAMLKYQINPDNKFYTDLRKEDVPKIIQIIKCTIRGLDVLFDTDGTQIDTFDTFDTPVDEITETLADEMPKISLSDDNFIRIMYGHYQQYELIM